MPALLAEGPAILRAWAESVVLGIDFVERSHLHLRLALRGESGPAKNAVVAANAVLVQQAVAEHFEKCGADLQRATVSEALQLQPVRGVKRPAAGAHGGNPAITMRSVKLRAYKQARAPDRPLTDAEQQDFQARFEQEREQLSAEDRENRSMVFRGEVAQRQNCPNHIQDERQQLHDINLLD